jgi:DNA-binding LacI/PurR family transcriptional regulator
MTIPAKHQAISQQLLEDITAGKYPEHSRLPSEAQLVKRFGVSRPTVIRALRDLEARGWIERRAGSGTFVRMPAANERTVRQLGLLAPGLATTEIFELIAGELSSIARADDYVLLGTLAGLRPEAAPGPESSSSLCDRFIEAGVAGVFFAPEEWGLADPAESRRIAERLSEAGIAVVLLDRDFEPFPQRSSFDLVGVDNLAAGYLAAEHLLKLGCRRIAFLARPHSAVSVDARIAGVREALVRRGIEQQPHWVHMGHPEDVDYVRGLLGRAPWDAMVIANDSTAVQLIDTLARLDVSVPRDLRIVGFDDAKQARALAVPLTTVHQPCASIARVAYRAMRERMSDPTVPARSLLLAPRLVVRESCGAYSSR